MNEESPSPLALFEAANLRVQTVLALRVLEEKSPSLLTGNEVSRNQFQQRCLSEVLGLLIELEPMFEEHNHVTDATE